MHSRYKFVMYNIDHNAKNQTQTHKITISFCSVSCLFGQNLHKRYAKFNNITNICIK